MLLEALEEELVGVEVILERAEEVVVAAVGVADGL